MVVGGLPSSGKSTLLRSMLQIKDKQEQNISKLPGLTVIEAAIMSNLFSEQRTPWLSAMTKEDAELLMLAVCLAQVCAKRSESLSVLSMSESTDIVDPLFKSSDVNKFFERAFERLRDLLGRLEHEGNLNSLYHASLAFMNIWDIGVNRAVFETMSLLARRCSGLVLVNVLSLEHDAMELNQRLNLQNYTRYHGHYSARKDDERVMQVQKAVVYYGRFIQVCNRMPNSSLLVGTHKDELEGDKQKQADTTASVKHLVEENVAGLGFTKALHPQMFTVDARCEKDAKKVCKTIEQMIMQGGRFERTVPLTWIMLRGVLQATEKIFMPKSELWPYASECGLRDSEELESWLELFQSCMSVIYSEDETLPSLHNNVIIHPFQFVQCLDRLYYAEFEAELQSNPNLRMHLDLMQKGIVTYTFAQEIWPDDPAITSKQKKLNVNCNFMLNVLKDLKICTKVKLDVFNEPLVHSTEQPLVHSTEQLYFIPSLRPYYSHLQPSRESDSLIVMASHVHQAPCDIYSEFLQFVQQQERTKSLKFVPDQHYDIVHFKWMENDVLEADIIFKLLDFEDLVEVSVKLDAHRSHLNQKICSVMKTTCVEFFHKISQIMPAMSYKLGVVSPSCVSGPIDSHVHVVPFELTGDQDLDNLWCYTCGKQTLLSHLSEQRTVWITCAYQVINMSYTCTCNLGHAQLSCNG